LSCGFETLRMRLLLYSHYFAPSIGGVETVVRSLAEGLTGLRPPASAGSFDLTVVTQTPAGEFDDSSLSFRVVRRPSLSVLRRVIASSDLVHVAGPALLPMLFAWLCGKAFLVEHHGFQTICPNGQLLIASSGAPCPGHFMNGRHTKCLQCNSQQGMLASLR